MRALRSFGVALSATLVATVTLPNGGLAAEAVFTRDGRRVYLLNTSRQIGNGALATVDVATGRSAAASLPPSIAEREEPVSLTRSKSGFLLFLFSDALWAYDPIKVTSRKVRAAEPGNVFYDASCDPGTGQIFVGGKTGLEYLDANDATAHPVSARRVEGFRGLTVLGPHQLLFSERGDAWLGRINHEEADAGKTFATLLAYRFAPVATLETGNYTPVNQGVAEFAVTQRWVYMHARRMGGSGDGVVVRVAKPDPKTLDDADVLFDLKKRAEADAATLLSMETLGKNGSSAALCTSPDGTTVFYRAEGKDGGLVNWLVKDGQPPAELP